MESLLTECNLPAYVEHLLSLAGIFNVADMAERGSEEIFIKKASLLWMLSSKGKKVSSDRVYRFMNERKGSTDGILVVGDYVYVKEKKTDRLVQLIAFRFASGKKYYGDHYDKSRANAEEVEVLCNFLRIRNSVIENLGRPQCYLNVKCYQKHLNVQRDLETGALSVRN